MRIEKSCRIFGTTSLKSAFTFLCVGLTLSILATIAWAKETSLPPLLFYFEPSEGRCLWKLRDFENNLERTYQETPECPDSRYVAWDIERRRTIYALHDKIFSSSWTEGNGGGLIGTLPPHDASQALLWPDSESGRPRLVYIEGVSDSYDKLSKDKCPDVSAKKTAPQQEKGCIRYKGQIYDVTGLYDDNLSGYYIAFIKELGADGNWATIASAPIKKDVIGLPEFSVLKKDMGSREKRVILNDLLEEQHDWKSCLEPEKVFPKQLMKSVAEIYRSEPACYLPIGNGEGLLAGLQCGDGACWTWLTPIFVCNKTCANRQKLKGFEDANEVSLSVRGKYVLVAGDANPKVYRLPNPSPVLELDNRRAAVWLPFSDLWILSK